jgi:non-specific serine/threonine protein kinase
MLGKPGKSIIMTTASGKLTGRVYEVGVLLNFNNEAKGFVSIDPVMVFDKHQDRSFKRIPFENEQHLSYLFDLPEGMVMVIKKLTLESLTGWLVKQGYGYLRDAPNPLNQLNDAQISLLNDRRYEVLQELRPFMTVFKNLYHLQKGERFGNNTVKPASLSIYIPALAFQLTRDEGFLKLTCFITINNERFSLPDFERTGFLLRSRNEYFLLQKADMATLDIFEKGPLMIHEKEQASFLTNVVKPLAEKYLVDAGDIITTKTIDEQPAAQVYLSELNENFLLIKLKWRYADQVAEDWKETETIVDGDNTIYKIIRKKEIEQALIDMVRNLHPKFRFQNNEYFYLNFNEALHNNWFFQFYNSMQDAGISVFGMQHLKKFRYNPNKPIFEMKAGNGIDWFDLTIEVSYGDLLVPLQELRKAIMNKQNFILLSDGSLGVLPEEWINKYTLLMRMGRIKEGGLQLSKTNWTIIDQLQQQINDNALLLQLQEKRNRLQAIDSAQTFLLPKKIKAVLRHYQQAGFQWLCLLDDWGWGGCLADDMGLGKTLQTICFLQHLAEKYPGETHLVVCPTSLIYNWEAELNKFAPRLKYHIHYGADRVFDKKAFSKAHLIITSYGMVRSDIEHFCQYQFGYVVLDESQAIKNPGSQITRAVQLLKARNRIALSGTPVQNNTFDLFAQMHFLNPGILGTQEFFKTEFATPIDKNGDAEKIAGLRQLVYPFMLRRTKEQVAKDLPDKTEMVLWCEMNPAQRKIYNSFKDHYRETILGRIAAEGMGKSSIYILEGLTKLRQICDSPAILNEKESYPNESIKLEELVREIEENTGHHKALVFSQFTSMLQLAAQALQQKNISYLYLDGSTTADKRKKAVRQFQEDDTVRVFLISLKAGGVGLNLTSADYVYLIDPWWNPAVEQQAIDRTHRIGQVKKVFAYRMICKDTIEEKMLSLQEKKKALAAGLLTDEAGFIKKLTKDDVAYLFS